MYYRSLVVNTLTSSVTLMMSSMLITLCEYCVSSQLVDIPPPCHVLWTGVHSGIHTHGYIWDKHPIFVPKCLY